MKRLNFDRFGNAPARAREADLDPTMPSAFDLALVKEEELLPSSGFLASVMERVQEEAAQTPAPAPISFPWKWTVPGILLTLAVLGWGGFESFPQLSAAFTKLVQTPVALPASGLEAMESAAWVSGALAVSMLCWWFSRSISRRSGLL